MSAGDFESVQRDATWRTNVTVFDKIFKFNDTTRHRPVFYSMPTLYNTEFDGEGTYRDMLYILLNSNISKSNAVDQSQYTLCGMNFTLMGGCSSVYMANNSGTSLMLNCQEQNQMTFPKDKVSFRSTSRDWVTVAAVWGRSVSLASGIIKGNAAMGSLLTQVAPTDSNFDSSQPSLADSLAILSAGTLLQSTVNAPFDGRWRFNSTVGGPNNILPMAVLQKFEAIVQVPDFSSGVTNDWKNIFVVVLLLVVILNIACLSYLIYLVLGGISYTRATGFKRLPPPGIEADITELRELFLVAIRSPAARFDDDPDADETIRWTYRDGQIKSMNSDSIA